MKNANVSNNKNETTTNNTNANLNTTNLQIQNSSTTDESDKQTKEKSMKNANNANTNVSNNKNNINANLPTTNLQIQNSSTTDESNTTTKKEQNMKNTNVSNNKNETNTNTTNSASTNSVANIAHTLTAQTLSFVLSLLLVFAPALNAAEIKPDGTTQTQIRQSANGITIVDIANPNTKGVSHNKFNDYNVDKKGVILNNAKKIVDTKLAGKISANNNLKNNAKVILNEVTSTKSSQLKGATEVGGEKASLILANPNGFFIDGAEFINTNGITITTAKPNGDKFEVRGGAIELKGAGITTTDNLNLLTKKAKIHASIKANSLNLVAGENSFESKANGDIDPNRFTKLTPKVLDELSIDFRHLAKAI